jgi:hypothetical protein
VVAAPEAVTVGGTGVAVVTGPATEVHAAKAAIATRKETDRTLTLY